MNYSAPCCMPPVCCHCGEEEDLLDDFDEYVEDMKEKYSVVRPIYRACRRAGKDLGSKVLQEKENLVLSSKDSARALCIEFELKVNDL